MDKKKKTTPRKLHDIHTQMEEESLWDLEDDWDEADDADEVVSGDESDEKSVSETDKNPPVVEEAEALHQEQEQPVEKAPPGHEEAFNFENDEELEDDALEHEIAEKVAADTVDQIQVKATDKASHSEQPPEAAADDTDEPATGTSETAAHVEPLKKLSLSTTEKIALSAIAAIFIGLSLYGYIWLKGKNIDAATPDALELPIEGEYATVTEFSTFWEAAGHSSGIKMGTVVVPAASITLSENSKTGALRIYFRNATDDSVGDPITISFEDGKFKNGSSTIEISASDGFHLKGDFHAYQMDTSLAWKVEVLEAANRSAKGSGYKKLFHTTVDPKMR